MSRFAWRSLGVWALIALVLAAVWTLYMQPDFMLTVAQQVWACF